MPRWFQSVETLPDEAPFTRELVARLGLRGINCGCGRGLERGWLNTDLMKIQDLDGGESELDRIARVDEGQLYFLRHDATEPYPLEDGCFDWAYSEHFFEHLKMEDGIAWLAEIRRVLRPGGLVRITTPNLTLFVQGYLDPENPFNAENREQLSKALVFKETGVPDRPAWMMNNIFFGWRHRWIYDFDELKHALVTAGFDPSTVVERAFSEGDVSEVAALDMEGRASQTLYVEARSPG